jgi:predicted MFS family arabinose efflux permease
VIGYGLIQSLAPTLIKRFGSGQPPRSQTVRFWTTSLIAVPALIAIALQLNLPANLVIISGLLIFGVVFAFNSSVHSYLVLAFTDDDKVALNVGFYYMANSGGRLAGTVLSGLVYQFAGLVGCLWVSTALVLAAAVITHKLPDPQISKAIAWKSDGE